MSTFFERNKFNEHLSDREFQKRKRKAYLREVASIISDSREETTRIANELESEEFFAKMDKEYESSKKQKEKMDDLEDFLFDDPIARIAARKLRDHKERELEEFPEEEADLILQRRRSRKKQN